MPVPDVIDLFLDSAGGRPSGIATSLRGHTVTYAAFEVRVRSFAGAFARRGRNAGILISLPQGPDAYAAMLGAGLAGNYYAPLNVEVPLEKQQRIVQLMRPDIIVAEPALAVTLAPGAPEAVIITPGDSLGPPMIGRGSRHEIAYIIFTSGTTGVPKGVVIPRTALDHFIDWVRCSNTITAKDRVPQFSNIAFDVSVTDIYGALCLGATLYPVVGRADRMFPARVVAREKLTVWNSTPSVIGLMSWAGETTSELLGSLRLINTCGEPLLPAHVSALFAALPDVIVQNTYGPTETTVSVTELRLNRTNYAPACGSSVAIGDPIERMGIHLLGGPHANEGEIVITGPQLAMGYWNDPEKTAAAFKTVNIDGKPLRVYFSGDWAERRDGYLFFRERIDLQVKIHGFRLELDEVAKAIHDYGFPVNCVLKWHDELAAVIERRPDRPPDDAALRAALAKQLEAHAIPSIIRWIDLIPRNQNDKLDRQRVAAWLDAQEDTGSPCSAAPS
jgi:D-alanine--poly(phosphoribitol) ligase subunit 1